MESKFQKQIKFQGIFITDSIQGIFECPKQGQYKKEELHKLKLQVGGKHQKFFEPDLFFPS